MTRYEPLSAWAETVSSHLPQLSRAQAFGLALWSFGMVMTQCCGTTTVSYFLAELLECKENTMRERLRDWYCGAADKSGRKRQELVVESCFAPLLRWVLAWWPPEERRIALALDASNLTQRFTLLAVSVLYRGSAIPVAWVVLPGATAGKWQPHWERLLTQLQPAIPPDWTVLVLADRGLYARWLYRRIVACGWHPFLRINRQGRYRPVDETRFYSMPTRETINTN